MKKLINGVINPVTAPQTNTS